MQPNPLPSSIHKRSTSALVTVAIQGESVRITGKSKDDLQAAIQLVKSKEDDLDVPLQFENYR